jgi:SPP1 gp7 family putative phage head morphogenesis protein
MAIKYAGYIYSPGTKAGFNKLQKHGIPRPIFSVENAMTKHLTKTYEDILLRVLKDFQRVSKNSGLTTDNELEDLAKFFEKLQGKENSIEQRANMVMALENLKREWLESEDDPEFDEYSDEWRAKLDNVLFKNQAQFLKRLQEDGSEKFKNRLFDFSIDKQKLFNANMKGIRDLYLDNSIARIKGEENLLKKRFLEQVTAWVIGESDVLDIREITKALQHDSSRMARFFARDQLSRLNKAVMISGYKAAKATKVKWLTVGDIRVRSSHAKLNGKIFDIDNLPEEINDYNCRCGLMPVEWED